MFGTCVCTCPAGTGSQDSNMVGELHPSIEKAPAPHQDPHQSPSRMAPMGWRSATPLFVAIEMPPPWPIMAPCIVAWPPDLLQVERLSAHATS